MPQSFQVKKINNSKFELLEYIDCIRHKLSKFLYEICNKLPTLKTKCIIQNHNINYENPLHKTI